MFLTRFCFTWFCCFITVVNAVAAPDWLFWPAGAMERLGRQSAPKPVDTVALAGAMGETLSCQVVLQGKVADLLSCTLGVSELTPGVRVVAHREHFVKLEKSSPNAPLPPGDFADPLVPANTVVAGNLDPALDWQSQPFWIDLEITREAKPGVSRFAITAQTAKAARIIPVELTIWPITFPERPTLASSIGLNWRRVAALYHLPENPNSAELQSKVDLYFGLLSRHGLTPNEPMPADLQVDTQGNLIKLDLSRIVRFVQEFHATSLPFPLWADWPFKDPLGKHREATQRYVATVYRALAAKGFAELLFFDCPVDEPKPQDYTVVRKWGAFLQEMESKYKIRLPQLVTADPADSLEKQEPKMGSIVGSAGIWVVHVNALFAGMTNVAPAYYHRRVAGESIWFYTSLSEFPNPQLKPQKEGHPFMWCLDFDAMNFRLPAWLCADLQLGGLLYWDTLHWEPEDDPWTKASHFSEGNNVFNGDGQLIYPPGHYCSSPCASMRLKWLRLGMQDHALIQQARQRHPKDPEIMKIVHQLVAPQGGWKADPILLEKARLALAERIMH